MKKLLGWLVLCFAAAATAGFVSTTGWYAALHQPAWNPPAWLFAPVWTVLYVMMAVAAWQVERAGGWEARKPELRLFLLQWALNAAWTPLFFGWHQVGWALVEIIVLWVALVLTVRAFWRVRRSAGLLLLPYLAWVTFAACLNGTVWWLNR